ncbi:MAG TPA: hypothetical protein DCF33_04085 [Saprospirales bacterium]|nr:hypothetical protein [Saprospirales bacterium]
MKKILILITAVLFLPRCQDDCRDINLCTETCDRDSLIVINANSPDLRKYVIRRDSFSWHGHSNAIKSVPDQGEIEWVGNNSISRLPSGEYYLQIANYVDTSWVDLEYWANLRERVSVKFNPYNLGVQKILNENAYVNNHIKNYAIYIRSIDDYTDASWDIDLSENSYVHVTKVDQKSKIAEGEFDLHFKIREQSKLPGVLYSDKLRFRCGRFKARIFE